MTTISSNKLLTDKVAVITGAARGIGLACAKRFVAEGAKVIVSDIDHKVGAMQVANINQSTNDTSAYYCHCDVTDKSQIQNLIDFTYAKLKRIDCVIANAGIVHNCDPLELDIADFDKVLAVNLRGVFLTGQIAAGKMLQQSPDENGQRGTIINMSSINAKVAIPTVTPYVIAKGGVNQWTKCLALRLADCGIRVNAIGPGSINTEMFHSIANNPKKYTEVLSRTPMGRPGEPDEVARVAVFLASDYASYITGETVYADGGRLGLNYVVPVKNNP